MRCVVTPSGQPRRVGLDAPVSPLSLDSQGGGRTVPVDDMEQPRSHAGASPRRHCSSFPAPSTEGLWWRFRISFSRVSPFSSTIPRWRCPAGIRPPADVAYAHIRLPGLELRQSPHEEDCAGHHPHGCSDGDPQPRAGVVDRQCFFLGPRALNLFLALALVLQRRFAEKEG